MLSSEQAWEASCWSCSSLVPGLFPEALIPDVPPVCLTLCFVYAFFLVLDLFSWLPPFLNISLTSFLYCCLEACPLFLPSQELSLHSCPPWFFVWPNPLSALEAFPLCCHLLAVSVFFLFSSCFCSCLAFVPPGFFTLPLCLHLLHSSGLCPPKPVLPAGPSHWQLTESNLYPCPHMS